MRCFPSFTFPFTHPIRNRITAPFMLQPFKIKIQVQSSLEFQTRNVPIVVCGYVVPCGCAALSAGRGGATCAHMRTRITHARTRPPWHGRGGRQHSGTARSSLKTEADRDKRVVPSPAQDPGSRIPAPRCDCEVGLQETPDSRLRCTLGVAGPILSVYCNTYKS